MTYNNPVTPTEIEQIIRANIDKIVCVEDVDGTTQTLFVHTVDEEGLLSYPRMCPQVLI
ncbi:MAG TPA: hypothetical protein VIX91_08195 [Candidatus Acidoferrum sp.]